MVATKATEVYRKDARTSGKLLTVEEREALLRPYLPVPPTKSKKRNKPVRTFAKLQLHILVFNIIHIFFSVYIRIRQAYHAVVHRLSAILYYHHRTPELIRKDVKALSRLPQHLSVILELPTDSRGRESLDRLLDDVAEVAAWCACAGIPLLSVYEKTGILKSYIPTTHNTVATKLHAYFGKNRPSLQVRSPHMPSFLNGDSSEEAFDSSTVGK
jgi:dehydrodolichyl diphosphate syntase complex subunit NUS1